MLSHVVQQPSRFLRSCLLHRVRCSAPCIRRRQHATAAEVTGFPRPGETVHGFTLQKTKNIPELNLTGLKLEHDRTGAQYLHVAREDTNNVFAINFKTNPSDDTGLPHILEHITLCGSEKYPVRDPFFKMIPRSLANFMNAFTAAEYTSYPFSTTNKQDFGNLSSVYLDSTLRPLLKKTDFLQEGWRLGPSDSTRAPSKENLLIKGVVYNEMKGQMSDASYLYYVRFRDFIYPSLHNSGGDPEKMTKLAYDELVDYSRKKYHPSNARFFSYGDLDLASQLQLVDSGLQPFDRQSADLDVRRPRSLDQGTVSKSILGPVDPMQSPDRQVKSSVSWLTCETSEVVDTFALTLLSSLLLGGYGSPLHEGLIETGLGANFSPNTGYDSSGPVGIFSIGLDGMKEDDVPALKETIQRILREKAEEAIQPHRIEGLLHQVELSLKHQTAAFGMGLLNKVLPQWFNGLDPVEALNHNEIVHAFRNKYAQPRYLQNLVNKYLSHDGCAILTMSPSESFNQDLEARESAQRDSLFCDLERGGTSPEEVSKVLQKQENELLREQEDQKEANIDTLPSLHVSDIPKQMERRPLQSDDISGSLCLWRETKTNGITYIQAKHELLELPDELRLLAPLFSEAVMRLGTKNKSVKELEDETMLKTGGISISPYVYTDPQDPEKVQEGINYHSYALDKDVPAMLELIRVLACEVDFSAPQAANAIQELLESKVTGALDAVSESGHSFAVASASAALSRGSMLQEQLSGLTQLEASTRLLGQSRSGEEGLHQVLEKLKAIQKVVASNSSQLSFRVICESQATTTNKRLLQSFKESLPSLQSLPTYDNQSAMKSIPRRQFFNLPYQVAYSGTCIRTAPYSSPSTPALMILARLLKDDYLHPNVREKGGAYGASSDAKIGSLFSMSSYRDPNPRNTLQIIQDAGKYAKNKDWSPRQLEEGKLSIFQAIDAPRSVDDDGLMRFTYGITEDMQQNLRTKLLEVTKADVQRAAEEFLVDPHPDRLSVCILGEKKDWVDDSWALKTLKVAE